MEPGIVVLIAVVMAIVGCVAGMLIEKRRRNTGDAQGIIYAHYSDTGSGPSLLLEPHVSIDDIASRKRVVFDVTIVH